jgi:uncharacterized protein (TIGR03083 family)
MDPLFDAYDRVRLRVGGLVAGADVELPVPACPGWTVRQVVAHLAGLADDVLRGAVDQYAQPEWTARQVATRQDVPIGELLNAWEASIPALRSAPLPPIGQAFKTLGRLLFADASVHEHDVRGALGCRDSDDEAVLLSLGSSVDLLGRVLRRPQEQGLVPPVRVVATGVRSWHFGDGSEAVTVEAAPFELWRGLTGRRTRFEVTQLRWVGDPSPVLPYWAFGPLSFAERPITY